MSTPGEIITLGLGNFGSLCAAHWCNSLTRYDAEHNVVFTQSQKDPRPRLLMLDAHQPSVIMDTKGEEPSGAYADASLLDEAGFRNYGSPDDDGEEYEDDEDSDDAGELDSNRRPDGHVDPVGLRDGEETKPIRRGKLFSKTVQNVPWWKYIVAPLSDRSIVTCDTQHLNPEGDVGLNSFGFGQNSWSLQSTTGGGSASGAFPQFYDNLRYFLEDCDRCQGVQVYADCNGAFGGLSASLAEALKDDFGRGLPLIVHAANVAKTPPKMENLSGGEISEEELQYRSQAAITTREQGTFNRLWSTHMLSSRFDLYCPLEVDNFFKGEKDVDVIDQAAYLSMVTDTAYYPCRDDGQADKGGDDEVKSTDEGYASHITMGSVCGLLRPSNGMRIVGLFANTLLFPQKQPSLWDTMSTYPLLGPSAYTACSFPVVENGFQVDEGLVLGHLLSLRGFSQLREVRYPHTEALVRHALPLRTTRYHGSMTKEPYPCSTSFPQPLMNSIVANQRLIGTEATLDQMGRAPEQPDDRVPDKNTSTTSTDTLKTVAVASHLVNTNACAPYLKSLVKQGKAVQHHRHRHNAIFGYETDEWHEMMDDVMAVRDEYDHAPPSDNEDEYSGDDAGDF